MTKKILFFSGSLRRDSMNCHVAKFAHDVAKNEDDIEPLLVSMKDFDIPLYDGDIENKFGMPEGAKKFKKIFKESHGIFIATPEYNSGPTGALKNLIDWMSRTSEENEPPLSAFIGKYGAISSATAGQFGGINGMNALRLILSNIGVNLIPNQVAIPKAQNVLAEDGSIKDEKVAKALTKQVRQLCEILRKISA